MSYETRTFDDDHNEPVVVIVAKGHHDVSRLVSALAHGTCEQYALSEHVNRQLKRHNGGRLALRLLRNHGGEDFTDPEPTPTAAAHIAGTAIAAIAQLDYDLKRRRHGGLAESEAVSRIRRAVEVEREQAGP